MFRTSLILSTALLAISIGGAGAAISPESAAIGGTQPVTAAEPDALVVAKHNCPSVKIGDTKIGLGTNSCLWHPRPSRETVRDHRSEPEIRDHRSEPEIRDHRSEPQVRDHRTRRETRDHRSGVRTGACGPGETAVRVRDHRTSNVRVRDHRTKQVRTRDHRTGAAVECR